MSRSDPYKIKRRSASQTLLMYGEGLGEETFLKYLKGLYSRDTGKAIKIRNGKGGAPADIVTSAVNEPGDFDQRIVIIDNDKSAQEMSSARVVAKQKGVVLLENSPCLEATLLSILKPGQSFSNKTSAWCKSEFQSNYLDKKKRTELGEYGKIFPKTILDEQRINVAELNALISLMER